jgi:nucleotide-binding universal stress UspA family protein
VVRTPPQHPMEATPVEHLSRILAAVDFSSPARSAFDYALALAKRHAAELVVIQAVPSDQPFNWGGREREALKASLQQSADEAAVHFEYRVQHGDPAEIILLHAHSIRPDVIVVGSHQRRGLDRWYFGSVSKRVVAKASVPVLVVPTSLRSAAAGAFRHVAVAVDLTEVSDAAIERALEVASDGTERITLLHAVPGFSSGVPRNLYRYGIAEYQSQLVRDARRALQLAVPAKRPSRTAIHTRVLRGDTTTELSRVVGTIGADLLVVGVPSRGIVANALLGTTASRLLKMTEIPVLAVPAASQRSRREEDVSLRRAA